MNWQDSRHGIVLISASHPSVFALVPKLSLFQYLNLTNDPANCCRQQDKCMLLYMHFVCVCVHVCVSNMKKSGMSKNYQIYKPVYLVNFLRTKSVWSGCIVSDVEEIWCSGERSTWSQPCQHNPLRRNLHAVCQQQWGLDHWFVPLIFLQSVIQLQLCNVGFDNPWTCVMTVATLSTEEITRIAGLVVVC